MECYYLTMIEVILILTIGLVLLSVSQMLTVRVFLKYLEVIPKKEEIVKNEIDDVNDYGTEKYVDLSEVTPEDGIKSLTKK